MRTGRPKRPLTLTEDEQERLQSLAHRSLRPAHVRRPTVLTYVTNHCDRRLVVSAGIHRRGNIQLEITRIGYTMRAWPWAIAGRGDGRKRSGLRTTRWREVLVTLSMSV